MKSCLKIRLHDFILSYCVLTDLNAILQEVNVYQLDHYQRGTLTKSMIYPYAIPFKRTHFNWIINSKVSLKKHFIQACFNA